MGKIIDITNQRFGSLTAIKPTRDKNGYFAWECKCDCGNITIVNSGNLRSGKTTSCGCLIKEKISKKVSKDLVGKVFEKLTVIEKTDRRQQGAIVWKCICECGKETFVSTGNLTSGHTKSCGCLNTSSKNIKNITNKKFGKLTVEKFLRTENNESIWLCKCDCGRTCEAIGWHLTKGIKQSCGCLTSMGENKIRTLLEQAKVPFEKEKTFETCRFPDTNKMARFDFYVNNKYLIEYDGEQHFKGWCGDKENLYYNQKHDAYKNKWCKENNIPLIRIPYTKIDTLCIEDLLLKEGE